MPYYNQSARLPTIAILGVMTYTGEAHAPTNPLDVHPLPQCKPPRTNLLTNSHTQSLFTLHFELGYPPLRRDLRGRKVAQHRLGHVPRFSLPRTYLHSPVPILLACLVCNYFVAIEL